MREWKWMVVFYDGDEVTDLDCEPHEIPEKPVLFALQPDKEDRVVGLNAVWVMWRRDVEEWTQCGENGFSAHARIYGHLIGCWRETMWVRRVEFDGERKARAWALARDKMGE